jgi:hypothetical protein
MLINVFGVWIRLADVTNDKLSEFLSCGQSSGFPKKGVYLMNATDIRLIIRVMRAVHVNEQFANLPSCDMLYNFADEQVHHGLTILISPNRR